MTAEEAYKWLYVHFAPCGDETKQDEAVNVALKALEKQIPKEPTESVWRSLVGQIRLCPTCRNTVSRAGRYCQNCGQRVRV